MPREIIIDYAPRPQQRQIHAALDAKRFGVCVAHRRLGKTVSAVNHLIKGAVTCPRPRPRFGYIAPTFRQAKTIAFDYLQHFSRPIPGVTANQSELRVDYPNGGQVRLYGADNPDSLRGIYLDGVVLDEFGLMAANTFSEVVRPALADRGGWALFIGTPNGRNQFYELWDYAQRDPEWFALMFKASETGIISPEELTASRRVMTEDEYAQEFECSFEASVRGAIYARELASARSAGRIARVPYDPILPVDTDWDLGVGDSTAIWFSQSLRTSEVRYIDYYEASGEGLPHYAQVLKSKGYAYGTHWAPFDIEVKELASGKSRIETARSLGINFRIVPKVPLEDGIHAARMLFPRAWFDAEKCKAGIDALMGYRWDYNQRLGELKSVPVHDANSHGADGFRYSAVRHNPPPPKRDAHWPVQIGVPGESGWMS